MNFQKLIEIREDLGLKQKDIDNILNITQQSYSLWENGTKIIPLKHINSLCNYYNGSMDYMLGLSNTRHYDVINTRYYDVINTDIDNSRIGKWLREFRIKK